jgi:hypothetical protein
VVRPAKIGSGVIHTQVDRVIFGAADQRPIEAGQPLGLHLALKLLLYLPFDLVAEIASQHRARPVADAMGDIVARDV